ncbi:MAG: hypothetical protein JNJ61_09650, partial [Anaerolineae bacterium]|nr:hypothetical protein [Anaerolineae bacterium]
MASDPKPQRSPFLEAADLPQHNWVERWARLAFRRPAPPPPTSSIRAQGVGDVRQFVPTSEGSGIFGEWVLDDAGLPAYEYKLDQYADTRAQYPNTEGRDRRDHWHQVGNRRVTAITSNDGTVQLYLGDRGGVLLNRFEAQDAPPAQSGILVFLARIGIGLAKWLAPLLFRPRLPYTVATQSAEAISTTHPKAAPSLAALQKAGAALPVGAVAMGISAQAAGSLPPAPFAYAGGYSYLDDGSAVWATAYRYRPPEAQARRVFGMGYMETVTTHRHIRVTRRVYAPHGRLPAVLVDIRIENLSGVDMTLKHYEYWDANPHHLEVQWLRPGALGLAGDGERRALNDRYRMETRYDPQWARLTVRQSAITPSALELPAAIDPQPESIFLVDLSGNPDAHYLNKSEFFGKGGARQPDAVMQRRGDLPIKLPSSSAYCLVLRRDLNIPANKGVSLRYAFGMGSDAEIAATQIYREGAPFEDLRKAWRRELVYFSTGQDAVLQREMAWHAYNLLSATVYSQFHNLHLVPQGSAYLYLHGADGALRDQALFVLPTTYLDAALAKDMLRLIMRLTDGQTGQMTYAFTGHGSITNGMNVHTNPSDLDLFFLLALAEYLAATGDLGFLDERLPYYPPTRPHSAPGDTVLDHIRFALRHLFQGVGIGENGLVKVRSGDWSDSIVLETSLADGLLDKADYGMTKENGESVPNTQMALYVLPLLAAVLKTRAPDVSALINDGRLDRLRDAVRAQWNGAGYYNRAVLRDRDNRPIVLNGIDLEAQPWALISRHAKETGVEVNLIERVEATLDRPSPIGASLKPGGAVWPAISQLLTWGYARAGRANLAWRSLNRHTFAAHAHEYPAIWYNIWTGPDGINGLSSPKPGWTWESPLTPMTDFPAMNANQDAMALLGLLRVCGIEPAASGDGLTIKPL